MPTIISYNIIPRIIRSQVFSLLYKTKSTSRSSVFMRTIFAKYIGPFSLNLLQVSSSGSIKKHVDQDLSSQSYNSKIYFVIHLLVCGYRRVLEYQGLLKSSLSSLSNRSEKLLYMIWKMLALYICWHPVTRVFPVEHFHAPVCSLKTTWIVIVAEVSKSHFFFTEVFVFPNCFLSSCSDRFSITFFVNSLTLKCKNVVLKYRNTSLFVLNIVDDDASFQRFF